jgi:hypothetical protein
MGDEIAFSAKYGDWIVIKRTAIVENTKKEEVAAAIASIDSTIRRKAFDFCGINRAAIDEYAKTLAKGKKGSYKNLAEAIGSVKQGQLKETLLRSCDEKLLPVAEAYFLRSLIDAMGFEVDVGTGTLSKIYPELKIAKPRGRFGSKKK